MLKDGFGQGLSFLIVMGFYFLYKMSRQLDTHPGTQSHILQSIIFNKDSWTPQKATAWLRRNHYNHYKIDETTNYYRFRQVDPTPGMSYESLEGHDRNGHYDPSIRFIIEYDPLYGGLSFKDIGKAIVKGAKGAYNIVKTIDDFVAKYAPPNQNMVRGESLAELERDLNQVKFNALTPRTRGDYLYEAMIPIALWTKYRPDYMPRGRDQNDGSYIYVKFGKYYNEDVYPYNDRIGRHKDLEKDAEDYRRDAFREIDADRRKLKDEEEAQEREIKRRRDKEEAAIEKERLRLQKEYERDEKARIKKLGKPPSYQEAVHDYEPEPEMIEHLVGEVDKMRGQGRYPSLDKYPEARGTDLDQQYLVEHTKQEIMRPEKSGTKLYKIPFSEEYFTYTYLT